MNMNLPNVTQTDIDAVKRLSYDERGELVKRINETDPHNIFEPAGTSSNPDTRKIICPICGNGSGHDHTPVDAARKDGVWLYNCFRACGFSGNLLKIIADEQHLNLNVGEDFNQALAIGAALIGYSVSQGDYAARRPPKQNPPAQVDEPPKPAPEFKRLAEARQNLPAFIDAQPDKKFRGLTLETLSRLNWGYLPNFNHPSPNDKFTFSALIIPNDNGGIFARRVDGKDYRNVGALATTTLVPPTADKYLFIVEGAIDGASIAQVTEFAHGIIATGGTSGQKALIEHLQKLFPEGTPKPKLCLMFDQDGQDPKTGKNPGQDAAAQLLPKLRELGFVAVNRVISDEPRRDPNKILIEDGADNLRGRIEKIIADAEPEFKALEDEMVRRAHEGQSQQSETPRKTKYLAGDDKEFVDAIFKGDASDLDFARRLERFCGDRVRWLTDDEKWLIYRRGSIGGGVWRRGSEKNATILPLARELSDFMSKRARNKHANELVANFKTSRKIGQAITLLKSLDSILITAEDLNRHNELLNVQNGVIDLSTGDLIPAAPELLLTQQINAVFDARADTATLEHFFAQIQPDKMTRAGLLRWLGYCLTGETSAEKFAVWIGRTGANGKGTLSNTILNLFGNYGVGLSPRALLKGSHAADADRATTSLNALEGARFAISEEMDMSGELDSSLIKNLAGGDKINLRRNYSEYRTLVNSAKLNISGNYMPRIDNVHDGGILRRLINFPFKVTFDKPDLNLKRRLSLPENLSALLLLLVREAAAWYRDNELIISPQMVSSRAELLNDSDFVQDFLADNYEFGKDLTVKAAELINHLKDTCRAECRPYKKRTDLIRLIEAVDGVSYEHDSHVNQNVFKGIGKRKPQTDDGFISERIISSSDLPPEWQ